MRDDMEFDPETDGFLDPMADPDWDGAAFEDDPESDDFDETLYLDEADRGSAAKRRHSTAQARHRRDTSKVVRAAPRGPSPRQSRDQVLRRALRKTLLRRRPELERAFHRTMIRVAPDRALIARAFPSFLHAFALQAATLASKKAGSAITPAQILQVPVFSVLAPALAMTAKRYGLFPRQDLQQVAETLYTMLSFTSLSLRLGASLLGEDEGEPLLGGDDEDYASLSEDGYERGPGDDYETLAEASAFEDEASRGGPLTHSERVAMSRALRGAARQLLRLERRLGVGG
ncbi:hypothetical protein [Salipiger mangrovisoli]|uniref:Uncharacterized protein n=1 Tax=Salipiger mangrovisoli TaxID=2865933 RepID=A0ABR9X151_9RHOB|nr:hypothetical protein [Salipiger mangrovisoli]MBE9637268.1 hypothetical protein [Salipiger mangrovisoli]